MALSIGTNVASLQASAAASSVNSDLETSMARLSTGKRINSASDDAAGVAIASRLSLEIRGTDQAIRNVLDGQALIDTAEGGHKEIEAILQRMREVAVQAANDTNSADDRSNLQTELDAMIKEIDRIASTTTWAGQSLMRANNTISLQVGSATGAKNQIAITITSMSAFTANLLADRIEPGDNLTRTGNSFTDTFTVGSDNAATGFTIQKSDGTSVGQVFSADRGNRDHYADLWTNYINLGSNTTGYASTYKATTSSSDNGTFTVTRTPQLSSSSLAMDAVDLIDTTIKTVNTQRSNLGAISNRLSHTVANLTSISTNLSSARGGIEDADFALETTQLAKNQILQQASTAMLAQANASKQNVLSLLQ